jgi:hypothetical protein
MNTYHLELALNEHRKPLEFGMPHYARVRVVTVTDDNFMTCSCKLYQRWLMPCSHMYYLIEDEILFTPDLFYIRWWKHFNYLFKKVSIQRYKNTSKSIRDTLTKVRHAHFNQINGTFKGIPLEGTPFLTYLNNSTYELDQLFNDEKADLMMEIRTMTIDHNYPLVQKLKWYKTYLVIENTN